MNEKQPDKIRISDLTPMNVNKSGLERALLPEKTVETSRSQSIYRKLTPFYDIKTL